jgi:predicted aspartyl protease
MRRSVTRAASAALVAVGLVLCISTAHAECLSAPEVPVDAAATIPGAAPTSAAQSTTSEALGRVIAPVWVNGQGPFRFIIDTGANRTVLSTGLAARLGLSPHGVGQVHSIDGVETAPLVDVASITYGQLPISSGALPMLSGPVLGAELGLLGVDGMDGRRLHMDFERRCVEISPAGDVRHFRGWGLVRGRLRFGHLVVLDGRVDGTRVNVLLDTGSDASLANTALRDLLERVRLRSGPLSVYRAYTAGRPIVLERAVAIPALRLGDIEIRNVAAYVGDFHIFDVWGMHDEPTLLLGMDVLSTARALSIDYQRGLVHIRFRSQAHR